ncbi:hypothetical protein BKA83DRAFT_4130611 [Pisolithus microcarpus]|nr:hypothetical protein BKA83DRAFT_4130611 [Pisolithus microcarpus]
MGWSLVPPPTWQTSYKDSATFFGVDILPLPDHHPNLINNLGANEMENEDSYWVVQYMDLAMDPNKEEESAVDNFAMQLLCTMGYAVRDLHSHKDIPLLICGEWKHAGMDVCIMDENSILLLIQEDKHYMQPGNAHAQHITKAIVAVQSNNQT